MDETKDILLAKWLSGEITEKEQKYLEDNYDLAALNEILTAQEKYVPETINAEQIWENVISNHQNKNNSNHQTEIKKKRFSLKSYIAILALLILAVVTVLYFLNASNEKSIETNEVLQTEQFFADGSKATIGPHSTLKFDDENWSEFRNITLSGQAFFEVEKGTPFTVKTSGGKVEVLGTKFDVWNIHPNFMRVSCKEGKVRVTDNNAKAKIISASEYVYIIEGKISRVVKAKELLIDWQQNYRNYEATPISVVLLDLERFYKIKFELEDSILDDLFTGILPINDLAKCIKFIETSLSYDIEKETDKIIFKKSN